MKQPVNFRFDEETLRDIRYLAYKLSLTRTQVVEHSIKFYFETYRESMSGNPVLPFKRF